MLARLAENLFWAGRYLERAGDTARLLDITYHGLLESPLATPGDAWRALLGSLGQLRDFEATGQRLTDTAVMAFLITDEANPGSVASSARAVRENVRSLREQVSVELWEAVNGLHLELGRRLNTERDQQRFVLFSMIKQRCQAISGVADETMARDDGYRFFQLGRQLERSIMTARLLDVYFQDPPQDRTLVFHQWRNLLRGAAAFEAYNRTHPGPPDLNAAVDYLLLADRHPRSVLFSLAEAESGLAELDSPDASHPARRAVGRVRAHVEFSVRDERHGPNRTTFLASVIWGVQDTIDAVVAEYFAPARPSTSHTYMRA